MAILVKTFQEKDLEYAQNLLNNGDLFFQHISTYRSIEDNIYEVMRQREHNLKE